MKRYCLAFFAIVEFFSMGRSFAETPIVLLGNDLNGSIYNIDYDNGKATDKRTTTVVSLTGITYDHFSDTLYGLTTFGGSPANSLVKIDRQNGSRVVVGDTGLNRIFEGDLIFDPRSRELYGTYHVSPGTSSGRSFFRINKLTGQATIIGSLSNPLGDYSTLAFDHDGTLYAIDAGGQGNSILHTVDQTSGAITSSTILDIDLGSAAGMAFHPVTGSAYVAEGDSFLFGKDRFFELDIANGTTTLIGRTGLEDGLAGLTFVLVIPEPSTLLQFLAGTCFSLPCRRIVKRGIVKSRFL